MTNRTLQRLGGALLAGSLLLATLATPLTAFAADPESQPVDAAPSGDVMDDGFDGEVVYDPYFIRPEAGASSDVEPTGAPVDAVKGDIGRPALTPPATDTTDVTPAGTGGAGVPFLLAALAVLSITVVAFGRIPVARRR